MEQEYIRSLRQRHNMKNQQRHMEKAIGDVVLINGDGKQNYMKGRIT